MSDVLVQAEGVSKKFCRSLKRSLWYGVQDVGKEFLGSTRADEPLRKNEFWAVENVSFELRRGQCLGLIGPNGAGKSTLLKMLNGLIKPDTGRIVVRGRVGALIELGVGFNPILTARENIYVNGSVLGLEKREIDKKFDDIVGFSQLEEFIDTPVQNFSSGMRVRLGFSIAAQLEPDVLLIDEILSVGDAAFRTRCFNQIAKLLPNTAVIFVSHMMAQVGRISTGVALMNKGRMDLFENQVSEGIAAYAAQSDAQVDKCQVETDEVSIESLKVHEVQPKIPHDLPVEPEREMRFDVVVRLKKPGIENARLFLVLIDSEMRSVVEFLSPLDTSGSKGSGLIEKVVSFNPEQLSSGKYYVSCAVLVGAAGEIAANWQYAETLTIDSGWIGYAPVRL